MRKAQTISRITLDEAVALADKHGVGRAMKPIGLDTGAVLGIERGYYTNRMHELLEAAIQHYIGQQQAPKVEQPCDHIRCPEKRKPGGCQLHNLQCGWPKCNDTRVKT